MGIWMRFIWYHNSQVNLDIYFFNLYFKKINRENKVISFYFRISSNKDLFPFSDVSFYRLWEILSWEIQDFYYFLLL